MIEIEGLSKSYGNVHALKDVSFTVEQGKVVGFLGINGAGKTTTMDILCGVIGADKGHAKICGHDITEEPIKAKSELGYLPDTPPLYPDMKVKEYMEFAAKLHKVPHTEMPSRIKETVEKLSLESVYDRLISQLSKGYRQRVALAQALIHNPKVLVLDEPTDGLDPNQMDQIKKLIRSFSGKHTVLLSSHHLVEIEDLCDQIIIIHQGRVIQQGTREQLQLNLEGGEVYQLRVHSKVKDIADRLTTFNGIRNVKLSEVVDNSLEFIVSKSSDQFVLDEVAKIVFDQKAGLKELSVKTKNLEELFLQFTK